MLKYVFWIFKTDFPRLKNFVKCYVVHFEFPNSRKQVSLLQGDLGPPGSPRRGTQTVRLWSALGEALVTTLPRDWGDDAESQRLSGLGQLNGREAWEVFSSRPGSTVH